MNSSDRIEKLSHAAAPLQIQLAPEFVHRVCAHLHEFGAGRTTPLIGKDGILFGSLHSRLLTVGAFEPFQWQPSDGSRLPKPGECDLALQKFITDSQAQAKVEFPEMVGWYSIHSFASPGLTRRDLDFHNRCFQCPFRIGLVFTPQGATKAMLELYRGTQDGPLRPEDRCSGRLWLDFEIASAIKEPLNLAVEPENQDFLYARVYEVLSSLETKSILEPSAISSPGQGPAPAGRKLPSISTAALTLITLGLALGWLYTRTSVQSDVISTPAAAPLPPETGMGMKVQSEGDGLLVSWNRQLQAVRTAKGGVLVIQDGIQHRRVALGMADVENGSVLYRPQSNDVSLALNLLTEQGSVLSEHVRVLDGTRQEKSAPLYDVRATRALRGSVTAAKKVLNATAASRSILSEAEAHRNETKQAEAKPPETHEARHSENEQAVPAPAAQLAAAHSLSSPSPGAGMEPDRTPPHSDLASMQQRVPVARDLSKTPTPQKAAVLESQSSAGGSRFPAETDLRSQAATSQIAGDLPSAPALGSGKAPATTDKPASQSGLSFVQSRPLKQVMPDTRLFGISILQIAKDVAVKVSIDNRGHVTRVEALNPGRGTGLLTSAALAAARQWIFQPASIHGVRVASERTIVFRFAEQPR